MKRLKKTKKENISQDDLKEIKRLYDLARNTLKKLAQLRNVETTQPARDVPGTSPEGSLKVLTSGTSRGPSGDSSGTNKKIDNLMKKVFFRCNSSCFKHLLLIFTGKTNMQKF